MEFHGFDTAAQVKQFRYSTLLYLQKKPTCKTETLFRGTYASPHTVAFVRDWLPPLWIIMVLTNDCKIKIFSSFCKHFVFSCQLSSWSNGNSTLNYTPATYISQLQYVISIIFTVCFSWNRQWSLLVVMQLHRQNRFLPLTIVFFLQSHVQPKSGSEINETTIFHWQPNLQKWSSLILTT